MKKHIPLRLFFVTLLLAGFGQACTDLEEELYSSIDGDSFLSSEAELIAALGAAYTNLYPLAGNGNIYSLQEVTSDEIVVPTRGNDWNDGGNWRRLHLHTYGPEDDRIRDSWNFLFQGINTCNRLVFQFEKVEVENKAAILSELKALRALFYWWALDTYGRVPIITQFDVPADFAPPNNTRQEVYDFCINELESNIGNLSKSNDATTYGRMNYWAAKMLLAKLYLNSEVYTGKTEWPAARDAAKEIYESGLFDLEPDYFSNFAVNNGGSAEAILAIPYDKVFAPGFNLAQMTLHYGSQNTYNLQEQPWNGFCTLEEFYNSYEDNDARKGSFLVGQQFSSTGEPILDDGAEPTDPDGPPLNFTPEINELGPNALRQAGARIGKFEYELGGTQHMSNDFPIFRYADAVLMYAEALWRINPNDGQALMLVNMIRERAQVDPFAELTAENLLAERGRELFSEIHRRTDQIRFGTYNDAWWEKPADPSDHVNIFPIPQNQLDNNQNLTQNPNY
ncbi:MAG: RagB/SusD family nutrient uptake outer membrane protein [Phaeodactylibacter sp.]|nr:RagB/SusD family nutrient uptake outer membrane protein [Phaeodactylibacter sp.]MCB9294075.1 RagB/SusD family nutrient uptake outer membrane protein [Lewinellaceae bacterium]